MGACWHGDVNFEAIIGWHAFAYICSLLGCFGVVPQINVSAKDFHDVGIEALNIYKYAFVIAYMQVHVKSQSKINI
jgi:hypothetical protein